MPFQNCRIFFGHGCTTKFWKEHYTTLANITFPHSEKNQENICYWYNKCKNHEPLGHHLLLACLISYRTLFQNVMFNDWTFVNPCNKLSINIALKWTQTLMEVKISIIIFILILNIFLNFYFWYLNILIKSVQKSSPYFYKSLFDFLGFSYVPYMTNERSTAYE